MIEEEKNPRSECYKCMRPTSKCICEYITPIHTQTRFIILMHPKEYKKEKNGTGRMTHLQLKNSEVIVGVDFTNNRRVNEILTNHKNSSFLLYPGENSFNLSEHQETEINSFLGETPHLFIIDGTWPCARKMLKLSKNLKELPRVSFDNDIVSKFVFKQQPEPLCLSTIESVYTVLNLLNEGDTTHFLLPFEKMIEQQVGHVLNSMNEYDPSLNRKEYENKQQYKKAKQRNVVAEAKK